MNKRLEVINCGFLSGSPFCLVYLFAKTGIELYSGNFDNIRRKLRTHLICHGIVHLYKNHKVFSKFWNVFGEGSGTEPEQISLVKRSKSARILSLGGFDGFDNHAPLLQRPIYQLVKYKRSGDREILETYRRMPSSYLQYFRDMHKTKIAKANVSEKLKFMATRS